MASSRALPCPACTPIDLDTRTTHRMAIEPLAAANLSERALIRVLNPIHGESQLNKHAFLSQKSEYWPVVYESLTGRPRICIRVSIVSTNKWTPHVKVLHEIPAHCPPSRQESLACATIFCPAADTAVCGRFLICPPMHVGPFPRLVFTARPGQTCTKGLWESCEKRLISTAF